MREISKKRKRKIKVGKKKRMWKKRRRNEKPYASDSVTISGWDQM